ncbi:uncharacterized protein LALA0_S17e00122g [Lachancea lanzarotensis]|uniref:LALA0S17e00122g1_1 n=1 Tax=Lachancea lanzarotensis TaxID=1245769 RepID=A0A0C7MYE9_9SACH|nr:uncharacterized protein LALA0_S17e00122g [Lachancea lanzarotensis]CEP65010.1 LALA0S17e00122g1_1 [Lachancea lanzarotensis]
MRKPVVMRNDHNTVFLTEVKTKDLRCKSYEHGQKEGQTSTDGTLLGSYLGARALVATHPWRTFGPKKWVQFWIHVACFSSPGYQQPAPRVVENFGALDFLGCVASVIIQVMEALRPVKHTVLCGNIVFVALTTDGRLLSGKHFGIEEEMGLGLCSHRSPDRKRGLIMR